MHDITILTQQFCDYSTFIKGYKLPTIKRYQQVIGFYQRFAEIETLSDVSNDNVRALFLNGRTEPRLVSQYIHYLPQITHRFLSLVHQKRIHRL